ncbi:MAG: hypothetical protein KGS72_28060 [Cyanobacteria bacterium REEB67]|jgi:hypothetical protein|nr:hypothetical protein [Cyanobacteria bacterium REEB67]
MQDFETQADDSDLKSVETTDALERSKGLLKYFLKRFILIVSFGPGVLGFLWLLGRVIKR